MRQIACTAVAARPTASAAGAAYTVRSYDPAHERGGWEVLAAIHRAYNTRRPLTAVRDAVYWRYIAARVGWWLTSDQVQILVAAPVHQEADVRAYAIAGFSADHGVRIVEIGALPGDEGALEPLLTTVAKQAVERGMAGRPGAVPREPRLDAILATLCSGIEDHIDPDWTARAIGPNVDERALIALPDAPGAVAWLFDDV